MEGDLADGPDGAAFADFVESRLGSLYRYAVVLCGNPHDAEELVQEALTRTGAAWSRVRDKQDPEGYVRRVMVRLMCNRWRRPRREWLTREPPERSAADGGLRQVEDESSFVSLLARLPARQRGVLVLRYVEDLTEREIAEVMGCTPGTVKSQTHKAMGALRAFLTLEQSRGGAS